MVTGDRRGYVVAASSVGVVRVQCLSLVRFANVCDALRLGHYVCVPLTVSAEIEQERDMGFAVLRPPRSRRTLLRCR